MSSPPLWMPGALRIESTRRNPLNNNGFRLLTWHTFEAPYSLTVPNAMRFLIRQGSEAFVFHPITGEWAQCQPMNTGARTLKSSATYPTNRFGTVHQQVEVIAYAKNPWTDDLTDAGREGLARGLAFFRAWGIPDQWAWKNQPPPKYPGGSVRRRNPEQSGHAYHSGWPVNDHGDPGAIAAPWTLAPGTTTPGTVRQGDRGSQVAAVQEYLDALLYDVGTVDGVAGAMFDAALRDFQKRNGLDVDGVAGPKTLTALRSKEAIMARLDEEDVQRIAVAVRNLPVYRPNDPRANATGHVTLLQELADSKTAGQENAVRLGALEAALSAVGKGGPIDLDAVREAAAQGAESALSDLRVVKGGGGEAVNPSGYVSGVRHSLSDDVEDVDKMNQEA